MMMCLFWPLTTILSPLRVARVLTFETSVPGWGSVRAKTPMSSPRNIGARYLRFCSSLPSATMPSEPMPVCPSITVVKVLEILPVSS